MKRAALTESGNPTLMTVERGLEVLRAFRSDRTPLSNAELVKRTGLPKATVSRLTSTLLEIGFLRLVPGRREFELSNGALSIGQAYLSTSELLQAVQPLMQELADRLDASVALGIRDGIDMLYVGYRVSRNIATLRLGVGSVLPMSTTSIGRAYLWGLTLEERTPLIDEYKYRAGLYGAELEKAIQTSFAELECSGTCAVQGGFQRDTVGVALPLRIGRQATLVSLSCGKAGVALNLQSEHERISPALKETAHRLQVLLEQSDSLL